MNICFISGKVIEEVEFKFYLNNKKISVAKTKIMQDDKTKVTIKGYNEMADWMYQNIHKNDEIYIEGKLNSNMEVEISWILCFS